ncbi:hypothetical protein LSH36_26g15165 [Paralvinella palmiformis]|uniref:SPRY domain-containing protein n=1 Tax=Paralvinella palmiformis TaxID=53620 RepID=A0AAD9K9N6_9ANNE|nr:hypothetical protein LSH36_26g15165 [Paralvinella palmiformis]
MIRCKPLVKFKSLLYYEEKDHIAEEEKNLRALSNSKIIFYKNGKCEGVGFQSIYAGTYFPGVSLYKNSSVTVNFGPKFEHPPDTKQRYKPFSDIVEQAYVEYALGDILYHIEHEGQLPEF